MGPVPDDAHPAVGEADVISLPVGFGIAAARAVDRRTLAASVHGFTDPIRVGRLGTPIALSSVILRAGDEDIPGPSSVAPDGLCSGGIGGDGTPSMPGSA